MKTSKKILAFGLAGTLSASLTINSMAALTYPTFSDVSSNHWAKPAITEMAIRQVMEGVGGNSFAPEQQITYAEWAKMICITFYSHKMVKGSGNEWYSDYIATVDSLGLFKGTTSYDSSNPLVPATRYDTAHIADRVLADKKVYWHQDFQRRDVDGYADLGWGDFNINNYASVISDWASIPAEHREAVAYCYWAGILNGTGDGSFAGEMSLDRAQAAQILNKLIEVCDDNAYTGFSGTNLIKNRINEGEDRRNYTAVTPVTHVTRRTQFSGCTGVREEGEGDFIFDPHQVMNGSPGASIETDGYSTLSFTVSATEADCVVCVSGRGATNPITPSAEFTDPASKNYNPTITDCKCCVLVEVIPVGTTKEFTVDISGTSYINIKDYDYNLKDGVLTLSDIVLE